MADATSNKNPEPPPVTIGKAQSFLANSSETVRKPFRGAGGVFQVIWVEQIDAHALFFQREGLDAATMLATHHNGHSCHRLAEYLATKEIKKACRQLQYIKACGGTGVDEEFLPGIESLPPEPDKKRKDPQRRITDRRREDNLGGKGYVLTLECGHTTWAGISTAKANGAYVPCKACGAIQVSKPIVPS